MQTSTKGGAIPDRPAFFVIGGRDRKARAPAGLTPSPPASGGEGGGEGVTPAGRGKSLPTRPALHPPPPTPLPPPPGGAGAAPYQWGGTMETPRGRTVPSGPPAARSPRPRGAGGDWVSPWGPPGPTTAGPGSTTPASTRASARTVPSAAANSSPSATT